MVEGRWNHNIHHHRVLLGAAPAGVATALDVGCGEGLFTRRLANIAGRVVGLDPDVWSIRAARRQAGDRAVSYVLGDVPEHPFEPGSFDLVSAIAVVHHLEATAARTRLRDLVTPGGTLVILGCARSVGLRDLPFEAAGVLTHRVLSVRRAVWDDRSPKVWPPPETYLTMCRLSTAILPGSRFRRPALWRYSVTWTKPT